MINPQDQSSLRRVDPSDAEREVRFWGAIFHEIFADDHMQYGMYSELVVQTQCLRDIAKSSASAIRPDG
jgi:hypothetical protein